jgi:hypothetical protein
LIEGFYENRKVVTFMSNEMEKENNQNNTSININSLIKNLDLNALIKNMDWYTLINQMSNMTIKEPTKDPTSNVNSLMNSINLLSSLMKETTNNDLLKNLVEEPNEELESPEVEQNSPQPSVNDHAELTLTEKMDQILNDISELKQSIKKDISELKNELETVKQQNNKLYEKTKNTKKK